MNVTDATAQHKFFETKVLRDANQVSHQLYNGLTLVIATTGSHRARAQSAVSDGARAQWSFAFIAIGGEVDQDGQPRLKSFQLSIGQLLTAMFCIAIGMTCLRLSYDRRFAGGSVPNVYLIVIGLALFVVIPTFSLFRAAKWTTLAKFGVSLALSILIVMAIIAILVLSGTI